MLSIYFFFFLYKIDNIQSWRKYRGMSRKKMIKIARVWVKVGSMIWKRRYDKTCLSALLSWEISGRGSRGIAGFELTSIICRTRIQPETVLREICTRACTANTANLSTAPKANALLCSRRMPQRSVAVRITF